MTMTRAQVLPGLEGGLWNKQRKKPVIGNDYTVYRAQPMYVCTFETRYNEHKYNESLIYSEYISSGQPGFLWE